MVAKRLRGARRAMSLMLVLSLIAGLMMFTAGSALGIPAGGNNSDSAKLCEDWDDLYRSDATAFSNWGDCAAYAARGGVIHTATLTPNAFQSECLEHGTSEEPKVVDGSTQYLCTGLTMWWTALDPVAVGLVDACVAIGGLVEGYPGEGDGWVSCSVLIV